AYLGLSTSKFWRVYSSNLHYDYLYQNADLSLKEHIRPIENPLLKILKIRGVVYDIRPEYYRNTPEKEKMEILIEEGKNNVGVIAQELLEVFPELVNHNKESGLYEVNYIGLISVLIEAMKEQQTQIASLTEKLDALGADQ
ncbi:MAG TPA: tail fiber domain-containing protein, partial [Bacteroidaceae bacterium]|nr:tail fiber domain-containing protein [Bacteroidaceae bacterium]